MWTQPNVPRVTLQTIAIGTYQAEVMMLLTTLLKGKRKTDAMVGHS